MSATDHPEGFRIEDLARPRLPRLFRALNSAPAWPIERWLPFEADSLVRAARRRTGLTDLGGDDWREPLDLMLEDLRTDTRITPLGRLTARAIFTQAFETRLCVQHQASTMPTGSLAPVRAPLVIVGLPRTGTTHLHNLLAAVPALRFLPLWQSVQPFRAPGWRRLTPDLRRQRTAARLHIIDHLLPHLRSMHEMEVDLPHEELQLCAPAFRSFFFESSLDIPRYRTWYAGRQHGEAYTYLRQVLQLLQRDDPNRRWILKSPQHLDQLPALMSAFPDALILRTHRDPGRAALSLITMIVYTRRVLYRQFDVGAESRAWMDRLAQMLKDASQQAAAVPASQCFDVHFDEFMADPVGMVGRILRFAGLEWDMATRSAVERYQRAAPPNRHGRIIYDDTALGLNPNELRERFGLAA